MSYEESRRICGRVQDGVSAAFDAVVASRSCVQPRFCDEEAEEETPATA